MEPFRERAERLPAGPREAVDEDLGLLQARASQFPVTLDSMDLLASRNQADDVRGNVVAGRGGKPSDSGRYIRSPWLGLAPG